MMTPVRNLICGPTRSFVVRSVMFTSLISYECRQFDKDNIDPEIIKKLQPITSKDEFEPKKVRHLLSGCVSLQVCPDHIVW